MLDAIPAYTIRRRCESAFGFMFLASDLVREVVSERELHLVAVAVETVGEVLAASPLKFPAHHHVLDGVMQQVDQRVLPDLECVRRLQRSVIDVLARIADR